MSSLPVPTDAIGGIVKWDQVVAGKPQYEEGRRLYTAEVNAAVRGAKKAGAKEIIVYILNEFFNTVDRNKSCGRRSLLVRKI
ncbi:MAG: M55 family metallopeptidase [Verrucomicrobia bacterium]|nr:M55 family metallopeptidase [Verrucomicrobiota bacterium]MBS0646873.1 M55 family metallopeptidase [Verrucomicrobiota bacterium]